MKFSFIVALSYQYAVMKFQSDRLVIYMLKVMKINVKVKTLVAIQTCFYRSAHKYCFM